MKVEIRNPVVFAQQNPSWSENLKIARLQMDHELVYIW